MVLALATRQPLVVEGITNRKLAVQLLEQLALLSPCEDPYLPRLLDRLAAMTLPAGPVLLVSTRPSSLADTIAGRLHRPVAYLDMKEPALADFYEKAQEHAP